MYDVCRYVVSGKFATFLPGGIYATWHINMPPGTLLCHYFATFWPFGGISGGKILNRVSSRELDLKNKARSPSLLTPSPWLPINRLPGGTKARPERQSPVQHMERSVRLPLTYG